MHLGASKSINRAIGSILQFDDTKQQCLYDIGVDLGISFQIKDDCQDFTGDEAKTGKKAGIDIACNMVTAPVLVALNNSDNSRLMSIIRRRRMRCHCSYVMKEIKNLNGVEISSIASLEYNRSCIQKLKHMGINSISLNSQIIKSACREN